MGGVFTRDERIVIVFLTASIVLGSLVVAARRVYPDLGSELGGSVAASDTALKCEAVRKIVLNGACAEELELLPGVGPKRAASIIELREELGGFRTFEDLLEVRGIGPKTLDRIRAVAVLRDSVAGRASP